MFPLEQVLEKLRHEDLKAVFGDIFPEHQEHDALDDLQKEEQEN